MIRQTIVAFDTHQQALDGFGKRFITMPVDAYCVHLDYRCPLLSLNHYNDESLLRIIQIGTAYSIPMNRDKRTARQTEHKSFLTFFNHPIFSHTHFFPFCFCFSSHSVWSENTLSEHRSWQSNLSHCHRWSIAAATMSASGSVCQRYRAT